jgi:hypothetical protein
MPRDQLLKRSHVTSLRRPHQCLIIGGGLVCNSHRFDGAGAISIQPGLEFSFGRGKLAGHARVPLTGHVHGLGKRLKQGLRDMVWFVTVKQF